jgi:hypothetical protein
MGWFSKKKQKEVVLNTTQEMVQTEPLSSSYQGNWAPIRSKSFDGEKTPGEMGNVINLFPNHRDLRLRAYEAELKSDVVKIITGKFFKWVIGNGLKLQAEPNEKVLESEGVFEDFSKFRPLTESRFSIHSNSKFSDYSKMSNLHVKANEAYKAAFLGGDCLIVLRVLDGCVNVQVIDGQEVSSPMADSKFYAEAKSRGNKIRHGIEIAPNGEHVAFYVVKDCDDYLYDYERVESRSKQTGRLMAWMLYGTKHRINHHRGIPQITAILEKVEKLDRYTEASVGGAEERAKIVFSIEHSRFSTGENPVIGNLKKNLGGSVEEDPYKLGQALEKDISATTSKQTFNLPVGAKLSALASNQENQYSAFFEAVFVQLCAAVDIPPEVALQKYSSNYSASRAAINGWGYIIDVYRKDFSHNFYRNFYNLWLEVEILKDKIKAPGYIKAIHDYNYMAMESYSNCKFTGVNMPHIDPLKEVKAIRAMLGDKSKEETPLISHDRASEQLNQGEWSENYIKYLEEEKIIEPNKLADENNDKNKE